MNHKLPKLNFNLKSFLKYLAINANICYFRINQGFLKVEFSNKNVIIRHNISIGFLIKKWQKKGVVKNAPFFLLYIKSLF